MPIIFLEGAGHEVSADVAPDCSILEAALGLRLPHVHDCGGHARCSTCRVQVIDGLENLPPRSDQELEIARTYGWPDDIRLACQTTAQGDLRVQRLVHHDERRLHADENSLSGRSEELQLAVLFCDINGFTDFAAGCMPYDVVHVINRLFLRMGEAVLANCGYIDKYIGDGMLALWGVNGGSPRENCLAAVRAALLMQRWVREIGSLLTPHFGRELSLRMGIHFGPAIVGRIGHPARQQITAIGDTVNIASRVEAANKDLRTQFLVTEECHAHIDGDVIVGDDFKTVLRGQSRPQRLHEIVGLAAPDTAFIAQSQLTRIEAMGEELVHRFYANLLTSPEIGQLFDHTEMARQHRRFLDQLTSAVRELRTPRQAAAHLAALGSRHRGYGVKPEHFDLATSALLKALAEVLKDEFDARAEAAWREIIGTVVTHMRPALS